MKRIFQYLQGTKDNGLVFNPSNKMVVDLFADDDFARFQGNENPQDLICDRIRTVFVVTFSNCILLCVTKLHI